MTKLIDNGLFPGRFYHSSRSVLSGDPPDTVQGGDDVIPSHSEPTPGGAYPSDQEATNGSEEFDPEVMLDQVTREMLE